MHIEVIAGNVEVTNESQVRIMRSLLVQPLCERFEPG